MVKARELRKRETKSAQEARDSFSDCLESVAYRGERIVVTRFGKELAALVSMDDLKKIEAA